MPEPAQTPASRRFVQPSSSSKNHPPAPPSSSRRAQFSRPSQPSSSSPFARTPFSKQTRNRDDIETSFEEEIASPSEIPPPASVPRSTHTQKPSLKSDYIEDDSDDQSFSIDSVLNRRVDSNIRSRFERDTPPRTDSPIPSPGKAFSSPLPKRQKLSHPQPNWNAPVEISSSPSPSQFDDNEIAFSDPEPEDAAAAATSAIADIEHHSTTARHNTEDTARAKFRLPTSTLGISREANLPKPNPKPLSRNIFLGTSTTHNFVSESPLPATFSPSRRKGKNEYIYNGSAETVRRWILDLAASSTTSQQSGPTTTTTTTTEQQHQNQNQQPDQIKITTISRDESGRFRVVQDVETKKLWMLIGQDEHETRNRQTNSHRDDDDDERRRRRHEEGDVDGEGEVVESIILKNRRSTTWEIQCPNLFTSNESEFSAGGSLNVAVLWETKR